MQDFPDFMKHPSNRIATTSQATPGIEGYIFDGADGSQMAFWTCRETAASPPHTHDFDEYMLVVAGCYTLIIHTANGGEEKISLRAGEEYIISRGTPHGGEVVAGTRTIHAFAGRRADRVKDA
jgi:quercetin dioxygenase-like cupin family protein